MIPFSSERRYLVESGELLPGRRRLFGWPQHRGLLVQGRRRKKVENRKINISRAFPGLSKIHEHGDMYPGRTLSIVSDGMRVMEKREHMSTRVTIVFILGLCLILNASAGVLSARAGGKTGPSAATATFRDLIVTDAMGVVIWGKSDQIRSDGKGEYANGSNVTCYVDQTSSGTGQFLLKLEPVGKVTLRRSFWFDYNHPLNTDCDPEASGSPGLLNDFYSFLHIGHLGDIPVPGPAGPVRVARYAHFFTSVGYFRFAGQYYDPYFCSTNVVVSRMSKTQWIVATDASPGETLPAYNSDPNDPTTWNSVGNVAQLQDTSDSAHNYALSFQIVINCPTCK